jgi:HAE1 family hydrophobic/amphiphilic exporter-1
MYMLDFSLNIISLIAMSLVIGILVDDSIVVLENIYRHMERARTGARPPLTGVMRSGLPPSPSPWWMSWFFYRSP